MERQRTLFGCKASHDGSVVVFGTPFDGGTQLNKKGCALGPSKIREASSPDSFVFSNSLYYGKESKILDLSLISDIGDIPNAPEKGFTQYLERVSQLVSALISSSKRPLVLGGDHSITLACLRGLNSQGIKPTVIHFDAHQDTAFGEDYQVDHSTFISNILNEGLTERVIQIGTRGITPCPPYTAKNLTMIHSPTELARERCSGAIYITVDTDVFDSSIAPGVSFSVPDGLHAKDFTKYIEVIHSFLRQPNTYVVGSDWMEFNPTFDNRTQSTASLIVNLIPYLCELLLFSSHQAPRE